LHLAQFFDPITFEDAVEVLVLADKYLVEPLKDHCIQIIEMLITETKIWIYLNKHMPSTINHVQAEKACIKVTQFCFSMYYYKQHKLSLESSC
jgi:hypothetical protein